MNNQLLCNDNAIGLKRSICLFLSCLLLASCGALKETGQFAEGYYYYRNAKVYITKNGDSVTVYGAHPNHPIDTVALLQLPAPAIKGQLSRYVFSQSSFDLDVVTTPLKYRPPVAGFPRQLNSQINGGVYIGKRRDNFTVRETHTPLLRNQLSVNHFGFSYGAFIGLGATAMNSWVTNNGINIEYDGVVLTKGLSFIIGLNKVNIGLAIGTDHLLDPNRKVWIYEEKPWIGLAVGLNLN